MKLKRFFCVFNFVFAICPESGENQVLRDTKERFPCDGQRSIEIERFCNGVRDCPDGEDETPLRETKPTDEWQSCVNSRNGFNGSCSVRRDFICSEDVVCSNVNPCDLHCNDTHYICQGTNTCVRRDTVCNQNPCDGCQTADWTNGVGFKCHRRGEECILPQQLVLDDISDCDGEIDRCFAEDPGGNERVFLPDKCFRCLNDEMIIPRLLICDGVIDCSDLSDECLCEGNQSKICGQVIQYGQHASNWTNREVNSSATTVPSIERNQVIAISFNIWSNYPWPRIDESELIKRRTNCEVGAVRCSNYCIPRNYVCDGVKDCDYDEGYDYCKGTVPCREAPFHGELCRCQNSRQLCQTKYGIACDGTNDCDNTFQSEDECAAACFEENAARCLSQENLVAEGAAEFEMIACQIDWNPGANETLLILQWYSTNDVCDGVADCVLEDDESNCPHRLRCDAVRPGYLSVRIEQTCDGVEDCRGGEDEEDGRCNKTRFRCPAFGNRVCRPHDRPKPELDAFVN